MTSPDDLTPDEAEELSVKLFDVALDHEIIKQRAGTAGDTAKALQEKIEEETHG